MFLNLHLFDPAAVQTTSTNNANNSLTAEIKTYYEKQLLRNAEPALVHDQFAKKFTIPQGSGHTIEWRRFSPLSKKTSAITEGVTPDGSTLNVTPLTCALNQYGDFIRLSDRLDVEAIDPIVTETCKLQGAQAGLTINSVTRDVLAAASVVMFPGSVSARTSLTASSVLDIATIYKAVATLRSQNAPTINGEYVAIIHPWVANDLMMATSATPAWIDVHKYSSVQEIFNGEIGKIGGVRFVSSTEAKIWNDSTCPSASSPLTGYLSVFQTIILGAESYATTDLAGMGLEYIVKPLGYGDDPLNQRSACGWKVMKASAILNQNYMVSIETCSATKLQASAN